MTAPRKALLKPFQLLAIAAGLGLFAALIVLMTIRRIDIAGIAFGVVFIVVLVVLAMLVLSYRPNPDVPVYLDRFQTEDGEEEHRLRVDPDVTLGDRAADREPSARERREAQERGEL